jgi:hypothetical protein
VERELEATQKPKAVLVNAGGCQRSFGGSFDAAYCRWWGMVLPFAGLMFAWTDAQDLRAAR